MGGFAEGAPCWADVMLPDVAAGKRFYGELFGWMFGDGPYSRAYREGRLVAALAGKRDGRMPTVWTVYFAAPDIAALTGRVRSAGGQVVSGPLPVRDGTMALAADPEGAVFGLWQGPQGTGFGVQQEPMSFCWTELYSRDKSVVDPFYSAVFRFGVTDLGPHGGDELRVWSPAGTRPGPDSAVGGRILIEDSFPPEMPSHFLVYFRVPDCDLAAATVTRLGGRVHMAPTDTPYGRIAVFSDNQGADFAVLQDYEVEGSAEAAAESDAEATQEFDVLAATDAADASEAANAANAVRGSGAGGAARRFGTADAALEVGRPGAVN